MAHRGLAHAVPTRKPSRVAYFSAASSPLKSARVAFAAATCSEYFPTHSRTAHTTMSERDASMAPATRSTAH